MLCSRPEDPTTDGENHPALHGLPATEDLQRKRSLRTASPGTLHIQATISLPFSNQAGRAGLSVLAPKAQEQFLSTYQCDKEGFSCLQVRVSAANSAFHLHMLKLALIAHLAPPLYLLFSITTVTYLTTGTSLLLSLHLSCTCCPAPSICNDCKFRMPLRDAPAHYVPHLNIHYTCKFSTAHLDLPHVLHI